MDNVINDLNTAKLILCNPQMLTPEMRVRIGQVVTSAIDLLTEHEVVVRCKDCKYWENKYKEYDVHPWLPCMEINTSGNWFCAYGERK